MKKVRFQFTLTPNGVVGISSFFSHDLEIDFLVDGSFESETKIKKMLWEIFYTEYSNMPDDHKFSVDSFRIIGWSFFESKSDLPLTIEDVMKKTKQTYAPYEQRCGGQGYQ